MQLRLLLTFLFASGLTTLVMAQDRAFHSPVKTYQVTKHSSRENAIVSWPVAGEACSGTVVPYTANPWGYVAGTNFFEDREKAQRLEFTGSAEFSVIGVLAYFDTPSIVGDSALTAKVYTVMENGAPGELLATSTPVYATEVVPPSDTSVEFTIFPFNNPAMLESPEFFVSIDFSDLYSAMDTLGLFSTLDSCGDGSNTFERWADGSWASFDTAWVLNADLLLEAVVQFGDSTVSADDFVKYRGLRLFPATPNPADDYTVLNYGLDKEQEVRISLIDVAGRALKEIKPGLKSAGTHQEWISTIDLHPGTYYYRVATTSGSLVSTFMIQR